MGKILSEPVLLKKLADTIALQYAVYIVYGKNVTL